MAYCAKCGNVIDMSDSFCKSCGEKIKNNVAPLHGPKAVNENKMDQEQWNKLTKEQRDEWEVQQHRRFMTEPKHWWDSHEKIEWVWKYRVVYTISTLATLAGFGLLFWFIWKYMLH